MNLDHTLAKLFVTAFASSLLLTTSAFSHIGVHRRFGEAVPRQFRVFHQKPTGKTGACLFVKQTTAAGQVLRYRFVIDGQGGAGASFDFLRTDGGFFLQVVNEGEFESPVLLTTKQTPEPGDTHSSRGRLNGHDFEIKSTCIISSVAEGTLAGTRSLTFQTEWKHVASGIQLTWSFEFVPGEGLVAARTAPAAGGSTQQGAWIITGPAE